MMRVDCEKYSSTLFGICFSAADRNVRLTVHFQFSQPTKMTHNSGGLQYQLTYLSYITETS